MRGGAALAIAGALLVIGTPVAAAPRPELALLQDGQGLSGLSRQSDDVAVSPDGRHVYTATDGWVIALRRLPNGKLTAVAEYPLFGVGGTRVVVTPDGGHVLVLASSGSIALVVVYARNAATGALTFVENEGEDLLGATLSLASSRDGARVYVANSLQSTIVVYARDATTGLLTFAQHIRETDPGVDGLIAPDHLAVSPDGAHVYAASRVAGATDFLPAISLLRREADGALSFVEAVTAGLEAQTSGAGVAGLEVTPDGAELLALDSGNPAIPGAALRRFTRDPLTGRLTFASTEPLTQAGLFVGELSWFALRPDGQRVFAGGWSFAPIGAPVLGYDRDAAGDLTPLIRVEQSGGLVVRGAVSPDGNSVYVAPAQGVRVLVPEADPASAALAALAALAGLAALAAVALNRRRPRPAARARASARA